MARVRIAIHETSPSGYGDVARFLIRSLRAAGHYVGVSAIGSRLVPSASDYDLNVVVTVPELFGSQRIVGIPNVGFTMCESSRLSSDLVRCCNEMARVLVPSRFCADVFTHSGVNVPIGVVPLGVELSRLATARLSNRSREETRFLSVFQWTDRKDPESLLTAYWSEFTAQDPVLLTLRVWPHHGDGVALQPAVEINRLRSEFGARATAKVRVISQVMADEDVLTLHANSDCYVSAHHGEGWGCPLFDAMSLGCCCIAPAYGGNLEYMTAENSKLIATSMVPVSVREPGLQSRFAGSEWGQVDVLELRRALRSVVEDRAAAQSMGTRARADMLRRFSANGSIKAFMLAVDGLVPV